MPEDSTFDGEITITPPLTWSECRVTPGTDDAELRIDEQVVDGDAGQTRTLTGVAIVAKKFAHGPQLPSAIQAIIDAHPKHEFSGYIEEWVELGYRELPRRHVVKDRQVVTVTAIWPGEEPQQRRPKQMTPEQVSALLLDMSVRVGQGDSFDGSISYYLDYENNEPGIVFDVTAVYRVGNLMGQGGMRIIEGDAPTNGQQGPAE